MDNFRSSFNWQRQFFVTDHVKHKNGFTLYKIISVVFPKQIPEAGTKIVVWKRYSEFKVLHRELKRRHASLHIGEEFPHLIKSSFFDRFSLDVINERKKFISLFLNFIAKLPDLFTADIFVKFFQDGYNISEYDGKKFDSREVSPDFDDNSNVESPLILLYSHNMGQVLNSDGSRSGDESPADKKYVIKSKFAKNDSAMFHKLKKDFRGGENSFTFTKISANDGDRFSYGIPKLNQSGIPDYWEEAVAHANEACQQEVLGNYDISFAMYKTAIVCLLSGVQADADVERRGKVKELTSQYLQQAEWIYNNYLVCQFKSPVPKVARIPWRSRSQLRRYKVISVLSNNLLVQDVIDNTFAMVKGVLKSSCPLDRSEICILPSDMPYMIKLFALHETETTVFFVLEHVRYGRLWDHLEHYFTHGSMIDNLDTEVTCASPHEKEDPAGSDENSMASSCSTNDRSLSRLESSTYTDTMSCESLSSHDENYFDLIEDYARAKSQKLKEIQDFNERRKHVESIRPVKKTASQVDLKSMDTNYEQHRSHSLTDLAHECEHECYNRGAAYQNSDESFTDQQYILSEDDAKDGDLSSIDIDTQQLLRNAQRLIESINETLSKSENLAESDREQPIQRIACEDEAHKDFSNEEGCSSGQYCSMQSKEKVAHKNESHHNSNSAESTEVNEVQTNSPASNDGQDYCTSRIHDFTPNTVFSPDTESIPSLTEEYSITAVIQRNGVTSEMVKKWAAQILVALETLHANGVICRDLNPNNILLSDNGSIKLTYFYRYPNVDPSLNLDAKEKLYVAPEVDNTNHNVTFASDWWSFGAILYELITFQNLHQNHLRGINSHTVLSIPDKIPNEPKSLLTELLRYQPNERLGSGISGADDIKAHPYFASINWEDV